MLQNGSSTFWATDTISVHTKIMAKSGNWPVWVLVADYYSRFIKNAKRTSTTAANVILSHLKACHGIPKIVDLTIVHNIRQLDLKLSQKSTNLIMWLVVPNIQSNSWRKQWSLPCSISPSFDCSGVIAHRNWSWKESWELLYLLLLNSWNKKESVVREKDKNLSKRVTDTATKRHSLVSREQNRKNSC